MSIAYMVRSGRLHEVAIGVAALVALLVVVAVTPSLIPVSWRWGSYEYTVSLGIRSKTPERFNGSPYKDPEFAIGRWSYLVRITPKIGVGR